MRILFATIVLACAGAHSAEFSFKQGDLELLFDDGSGALMNIRYKGDTLATAPNARCPLSLGIGPQDKIKWLENFGPRQLLKREKPSADTLEVSVRMGDYELVERYKLVVPASVPAMVAPASLPAGTEAGTTARLDRSLTLINRGTEITKLRNVNFKTFGINTTKDGFYRIPQNWPPVSHPFSEMKKGRHNGSGNGIVPLIAQFSPQRSIIFTTFATDPAGVRVDEGEGTFDVVQDLYACGYLKPNVPQEFGFVSMSIVDAGYWDALPALWKYMDSVGLKVPADRPEWVQDAILYCFHPGGTIGSNFNDLGGFKNATEFLLPRIPKLGANAIWIMPIESKSPYWPFDYYKFMDGIGTPDEYKTLVKRAHELGLRVWQDMVPHGGSPQAVHNKAHPEFMLHREDGSTLNYWLNDFARPDWQKFMADVARHYCREYGIDGFRVDACGGSKEPNWSPDIPYARASHALLWGGIGMLNGIRQAVRDVNPKDGAILAEAENARLLGVSDAQYDFGLCYNVLHQWRKIPAADFVAKLQDYLEEQKYTEPRGTIRMRHVESHDSLRADLWYGVDGMHAMYALTAWIDGIPLMYQGMENGHSFELRRINEIRKSRPELSRGEAFYKAVKCDAPGVFTCLRKLGDKQTVFAINFGRETVKAKLTWVGGQTEWKLEPLAFKVWPEIGAPPGVGDAGGNFGTAPEGDVKFEGATEWWVETISGTLHGDYAPPPVPSKTGWHSGIYWRPQGTGVVWQNDLMPLDPLAGLPQIGARTPKGCFDAGPQESAPLSLRLMGDADTLRLTGLGTSKYNYGIVSGSPNGHRNGNALSFGPVAFRCVGPDLIVSNKHFAVVLRRQGGVIRELCSADGKLVAADQDLYGDQEYFHASDSNRIEASSDVECGLRIEKLENGLKLSFEGQLRGFQRFALKKPPLWFRNEFIFTDAPRFHQTWAFKTEKSFKDKKAFLSAIIHLPAGTEAGATRADRFRFTRGKDVLAEESFADARGRRGQTAGQPAPETMEFSTGGKKLCSLSDLRVPEGSACNVFIDGRQFFITLIEGDHAGLDEGRWYEFQADWQAE
ncbi:MAG TPA: alpha-amylase family glycosyl hydrolase [Planctomycetota bacterium]|jgi:hypothetical protein